MAVGKKTLNRSPLVSFSPSHITLHITFLNINPLCIFYVLF